MSESANQVPAAAWEAMWAVPLEDMEKVQRWAADRSTDQEIPERLKEAVCWLRRYPIVGWYLEQKRTEHEAEQKVPEALRKKHGW